MALVIWSPTARADLRAVYDRIARDSVLTADQWLNKLLESVSVLEQFPEIGSPIEEPGFTAYREQIVGPYRIIYHYNGTECRIGTIVRAERDLRNVTFPEDLE